MKRGWANQERERPRSCRRIAVNEVERRAAAQESRRTPMALSTAPIGGLSVKNGVRG